MSRLFGVINIVLVLLGVAFSRSQDTTASEVLSTKAFGTTDDRIHVMFVLHLDPLPPGRRAYERERDNLAWLADLLDEIERKRGPEYVPRLDIQIGGDHAAHYLRDPAGLALLRRLHAKGIHGFGTHFHDQLVDADGRWRLRIPDTPENRRRVTETNIEWVDRLVAEIIGSHDLAAVRRINSTITGHLIDIELARERGFRIFTGGANESLNLFFDHDVYTPWRPDTTSPWPLDADPKGQWVIVPQAPVLGRIGEHSPLPQGVDPELRRGMRRMVWQDLSLPAMRRKFIHLELEARMDTSRVWVFGWHEHTNNIHRDDGAAGDTRSLRDEVREFIKWMNEHAIGRTARWSNVGEVVARFEKWERVHLGKSSFEYDKRSRDREAYPYRLRGVARELMYAHHDKEIASILGVTVHEFTRAGGRAWRYERGRIVADGSTERVYLLSSDAERTIDFSRLQAGRVVVIDGLTGAEATTNAAALRVSKTPIVVRSPRKGADAKPSERFLHVAYNANADCEDFAERIRRHLNLMARLGAVAEYYFTGLAAERLAREAPDLVKQLRASRHGLSYHGANRPPRPMLFRLVRGEDWQADTEIVYRYERDGVNPATGVHIGGLAAFRKVFGRKPTSTGRFFEASILYVSKKMGARMGVGLQENTGAPSNQGWFLGVLNRPESTAIRPPEIARGNLDAIRAQLDAVPPGAFAMAAVLIHDTDLRSEPIWASHERTLRLATDLGFRFLTAQDILARAANGPAPTVSPDELRAAAQQIVAGAGTLPGHAAGLSLAKAFEGLARALTVGGNSIQTHDLLGPTEPFTGKVEPGRISSDAVVKAAAALTFDDRIPASVVVGGRKLGPAEFLDLMAQAYPGIEPQLRPVSPVPRSVGPTHKADPLTKLQFWTYKPVVWR